jgi:hypothetical protein
MKITKQIALKLAKEFNLNLNIVSFDEWKDGLNIELEHGKKVSKITNLTNDNLIMTSKIALAHLIEDPKYYKYLVLMEQKREKYWSKKKKPNIFLE